MEEIGHRVYEIRARLSDGRIKISRLAAENEKDAIEKYYRAVEKKFNRKITSLRDCTNEFNKFS